MPPTRTASLAASHGVVDRVHRYAPHVAAPTAPAVAARLADALVLVVRVANAAKGMNFLRILKEKTKISLRAARASV